MKPIAALIALLALALAATPAAAAERLAVESAPFTADAYGDVIAWSSYDTVAKTYSLRLLRGGQPVAPAVAASAKPLDLDVGPGPDGAPVAVYSRAGDIFQYDPATGLEQPLAEVNTAGVERNPSIHRSALGFVREAHRKPVVYLRKDGNTRRQPRPRYKRQLGVEDVELSARGLFVVYRTDIVPTCCSRGRRCTASPAASCTTSSLSAAAARTSARSSPPRSSGAASSSGAPTMARARATTSSATTCARASCTPRAARAARCR